jgi:hypothetical protein
MYSIVKMSGRKGIGSQKQLSTYITLNDKSNAQHILHYDYSHTPNFTLLHHMSAYFVY